MFESSKNYKYKSKTNQLYATYAHQVIIENRAHTVARTSNDTEIFICCLPSARMEQQTDKSKSQREQ